MTPMTRHPSLRQVRTDHSGGNTLGVRRGHVGLMAWSLHQGCVAVITSRSSFG